MECSLLSNCLPKINQSWTHLSWTHQCHPLLHWKRNQKNLSYGYLSHKLTQSLPLECSEMVWRVALYASCLFFPVHLSWKRK